MSIVSKSNRAFESVSQNTGVWPAYSTELIVAAKLRVGINTRDSAGIPTC